MTRERLGFHLNREDGHAGPATASIAGAAGVIGLGIGAATDTGWLAIAGGIVAGVAFIAYDAIRHGSLDKEFFRRTDKIA